MYINEIPNSAAVSVRVMLGGKEKEFSVKVLSSENAGSAPGIVTTDFLKDIDGGEEVMTGDVYFYSAIDQHCILWKAARIIEDVDSYTIITPNEGESVDRRGAERKDIVLSCMISLKDPTKPQPAKLHDISISGIAVTVDKSLVSYIDIFRKTIDITFKREDTGGDCLLNCICRNVRNVGNGLLCCGCTILKSNIDLLAYVEKLR